MIKIADVVAQPRVKVAGMNVVVADDYFGIKTSPTRVTTAEGSIAEPETSISADSSSHSMPPPEAPPAPALSPHPPPPPQPPPRVGWFMWL